MKKETLCKYRIWFITGSQHLYGEETLRRWRSIRAGSSIR